MVRRSLFLVLKDAFEGAEGCRESKRIGAGGRGGGVALEDDGGGLQSVLRKAARGCGSCCFLSFINMQINVYRYYIMSRNIRNVCMKY